MRIRAVCFDFIEKKFSFIVQPRFVFKFVAFVRFCPVHLVNHKG